MYQYHIFIHVIVHLTHCFSFRILPRVLNSVSTPVTQSENRSSPAVFHIKGAFKSAQLASDLVINGNPHI